MTLPHVLSQSAPVTFNVERYNASDLQRAARFWIGSEAAKFRKAESVAALTNALSDPSAGKRAVEAMSKEQRQVVSIYARYGPLVSGALLSAELHARGLVKKPDPRARFHASHRAEVVYDLRGKLVLVGSGQSSYYSMFDYHYPTLTLHPAVAAEVQPAAPLLWQPSAACARVQSGLQRSPAEVVLDLWRVASELLDLGNWKTNKGGSLAKSSQNRLRNNVPMAAADTDPMAPPDPQSLYYELLRGLDCIVPYDEPYDLSEDRLDRHLRLPAATQAWQWVRAWLRMRLWQDGIGVVPDRDNDYNPVRIEPTELYKARELLVWGLCRVAHSPIDWLDLEVFLKDLWRATENDGMRFYWGHYTWDAAFDMGQRRNSFPSGEARSLAFWLAGSGLWAANAVMVTLFTLGLVQRGQAGGKAARPCFRLTDLGRAVFGAPEIETPNLEPEPRFLTVQPNFDVLAYMDQTDARWVCTLSQFAVPASNVGGQVQTFTLQRDAVYAALEVGLTRDDIEAFLARHSRTPVPDNVLRMLTEWSGKRESLVLRTDVTLACSPQDDAIPNGRMVGKGMAILPPMNEVKAKRTYRGWSIIDHRSLPRTWTVTELGHVRKAGKDSISRQHLTESADATRGGWQFTQTSVSRARQHGVTADQLVGWLHSHLTHDLPPLLEIAVRNWTGRVQAFTGKVQMLQIANPLARDAILSSPAFEPLLVGHIPPDWFIVHDAKTTEAKQLLSTLGFSLRDTYQLAPLNESRQQYQEVPVRPTARGRRARRHRR